MKLILLLTILSLHTITPKSYNVTAAAILLILQGNTQDTHSQFIANCPILSTPNRPRITSFNLVQSVGVFLKNKPISDSDATRLFEAFSQSSETGISTFCALGNLTADFNKINDLFSIKQT